MLARPASPLFRAAQARIVAAALRYAVAFALNSKLGNKPVIAIRFDKRQMRYGALNPLVSGGLELAPPASLVDPFRKMIVPNADTFQNRIENDSADHGAGPLLGAAT